MHRYIIKRLLMLIPVLLFLNVLQKNIVGGLTVGSVKG